MYWQEKAISEGNTSLCGILTQYRMIVILHIMRNADETPPEGLEKVSQLYPGVMYRIINGIGKGWLLKRDFCDSGYEYNDNIPRALVATHHSRLVAALLMKNAGSEVFSNILNEHVRNGEFEVVLHILREHLGSQTSFDGSNLIKQLVEQNVHDELIEKFVLFFAGCDEHDLLGRLVQHLWVAERHDLAATFIEKALPEHERAFFRLRHEIAQKKPVTESEVRQSIEALCSEINITDDNSHASYEEKREATDTIDGFIRELDESDAPLSLLRTVIECQEEQQSKEVLHHSYFDRYEIDAKIRKDLLARRDFAGAEAFVAACGDRSYCLDEIALEKIAYGVQQGDKALYKEGLDMYADMRDEKIAHLEEEHDSEDDEGDFHWRKRINLHQERASKYAELALYELRCGDERVAQRHIDAMIEATEACAVPGKEECPEAHRKTLRDGKRYFKKSLKRKFLAAGYFDALPDRIGWHTPVKHPDAVKADREAYEERRDSQRSARGLQYEQTHERVREMMLTQTKSLVAEGKFQEAVSELLGGIHRVAGEVDWLRACCILEAKPELFSELAPKLTEEYFKGRESRYYGTDWKGLASWYATAYRHDAVTAEDEKALITGLFRARLGENGLENVPVGFTTTIVEELIQHGDIEKAWSIYNQINDMGNGLLRVCAPSIASATHQHCLAQFVRAMTNVQGPAQCVAGSLRGTGLPDDMSERGEVAYWNTEVELQQMMQDEEQREHAVLQLQALCRSRLAVREWSRLMMMGTSRTPHQKKDALLAVYEPEGTTHTVRWRIVDTLIDHKIPGAEAMAEINRRDTPVRLTKHFFRKLVARDMLHKHTLEYIAEENEHIPYLRQLLSEYQNEFNTVMDTIEKYFSSRSEVRSWDNAESDAVHLTTNQKKLRPHEWAGVLTTLRQLGVFTPSVYAEARSKNFDPAALTEIGKKIRLLKQQLFSSKPFDNDLSLELQGEIIYAAYKPANMDLATVSRLCGEVQDCSAHLERFAFPEKGYELDLRPSKKMRRASEGVELQSMEISDRMERSLHAVHTRQADDIRSTTKKLCNIGRFKSLDAVQIEDIVPVFLEDHFFLQCIHEVQRARTDNDVYKALTDMQEALGIYLDDNLERAIARFIDRHYEHVSKMIDNFAEGVRKPKLLGAYQKQCAITLDTSLDNTHLAAQAITAVYKQKVKSLQQTRKMLRQDMGQFVTAEGGAAASHMPKLRAIISKNVASFFGKASAGICTDENVELFHRSDHFHINIVHEEKQVCVGNVQAYIMNHHGESHLLLRGFNPSTALLKEIDAASFCDAVISIGEQFARANDLAGVILSEQGGFLALSNRPEATKHLRRKYRRSGIEIEPFEISRGVKIQSGYMTTGQLTSQQPENFLAEGVGFEPTRPLRA